MKQTDFIPRSTPFLTYLTGDNLLVAEVGSDVGAHAHALLEYCNVQKLILIDIWNKDFYRGYCQGRLHSAGFKNKIEMIQSDGIRAAELFADEIFDAIYIDITHDYDTVKKSLQAWWPKLKHNGVMGYRNYSKSNKENAGLNLAIDEAIEKYIIRNQVENGEIILFKNSI